MALAAEAGRAQKAADVSKEPAPALETPNVRVHQSKATVTMPFGQSLVLGGWNTGTNKNTYTFLTPTARPASDSVSITAYIIEIERALAADLLNLRTNADGNLLLQAASATAMIEGWKNTEGIDMIMLPTLTASSGHPGKIGAMETRMFSNHLVEFGPEIEILPAISADGAQVHLDVVATLAKLVNPGHAASH